MKRFFGILFFALISLSASFAQSIEGDWHGVLDLNVMKLRLVFHITKANGSYSGTMDSPDQNAKGIPLTSVSFEKDTLRIDNGDIQMTYVASLKGDSLIGQFRQMGQAFPLNLSRKAIVPVKRLRPQTPVEPFPYTSKEVRFKQRNGGFYLAGTLTIPKKKKNYPLVVMATGSGQQDRDETLFEHKPFWVIADYFARKGIATLRIDDRGVGQSEGETHSATTFDFAEDIQSAIDYLAARKDICTKRIGVVGHSEGGIIAAVLAGTAYSEKNPVQFIVMMAGSGVSGDRIVASQSEAINKKIDPNFDFTIYEDMYKRVFGVIKNTNLTLQQVESQGKLVIDSLSIPDEQKRGATSLFAPWYVEFIRLDPALYLKRATCPIFALIGSNDLQVLPDLNLPAIKEATKGNKSEVTIKEYPGLNHLFQHSATGLLSEYRDIEETISPEVLKDMAEWILKRK